MVKKKQNMIYKKNCLNRSFITKYGGQWCVFRILFVHELCFWHVVLYLRLYRTDSEIYEDAVELQQFFIKIRDELCKNGEILLSPALSYTTKHLHNDVEKEKKEKLPKEIEEDKLKREEEKRGNYFLFINIECIEKYTLYVLCMLCCCCSFTYWRDLNSLSGSPQRALYFKVMRDVFYIDPYQTVQMALKQMHVDTNLM